MEEPKVSVIVPIYNSEKYLSRCLDSILMQTYRNIEILCIDDGSTDKSQQILSVYKNNNSNLFIISQKNSGVCNARNTGIKKSTGRYIMFCDSDDTAEPTWVEDLVKCILNHPDMLCGAGYNELDENSVLIQQKHVETKGYSKNNYYKLYLNGMTGNVWAKIYDHRIINSNNLFFNETITYAEDAVFNMEYLDKVEGFYIIEKCLYNYYQFLSRETLSSNIDYEAEKIIFLKRIPYISESDLAQFKKAFWWKAFERVKKILNNSDGRKSLMQKELFKMRHFKNCYHYMAKQNLTNCLISF